MCCFILLFGFFFIWAILPTHSDHYLIISILLITDYKKQCWILITSLLSSYPLSWKIHILWIIWLMIFILTFHGCSIWGMCDCTFAIDSRCINTPSLWQHWNLVQVHSGIWKCKEVVQWLQAGSWGLRAHQLPPNTVPLYLHIYVMNVKTYSFYCPCSRT